MSSSERDERPGASADLAKADAFLSAAVREPDLIPNDALQRLMEKVVKIYGIKAEQGFRRPFPPRSTEIGADEVMVLATDMLHALNVQVFELSMWQAMTGNCIDPNHRSNSEE